MEPLSFATQMIFYVVFAGTLLRSLRTRSSVDLAVAAIFGTMAAIFGWSILNQLAPETFGWLRPAAIGVLLLQPVLVFWLVHLIRPLARWVVPAAAAGFIVATLAA
ncbi:MAG TPA: hypothetical protein VNW68_00220, partial [Candidatus Limnocylindria bacterium]|nr:hypothetical protein [Candidatus Limnocylindria bacterium]